MNPLIVRLLGFVGKRFLHFLLYLLLALVTIGIPYKLFVKGDQRIGKQEVNYYGENSTPVIRFGCATGRFSTSTGIDYKSSTRKVKDEVQKIIPK